MWQAATPQDRGALVPVTYFDHTDQGIQILKILVDSTHAPLKSRGNIIYLF